jgi:hypothetical protein
MLQITEKGGIPMAFLDSILIDPQVSWSWQEALFIQAEPPARQLERHLVLKTRAGKPWANSFRQAHMSYRTTGHLLPNRLAQSAGRSSSAPTGLIRLGKGFRTGCADKTTFVHHQMHSIASQAEISFDSKPTIMDLLALPLTMRAGQLGSLTYHLNAHGPIGQAVLSSHLEFRQIQGN